MAKGKGKVKASFPSKFMWRQLYQIKPCKWHYSFIHSNNIKLLGARTLGNKSYDQASSGFKVFSVFEQMFEQINCWHGEDPSAVGNERASAWESWGWGLRAAFGLGLKNKTLPVLATLPASLIPDEYPHFSTPGPLSDHPNSCLEAQFWAELGPSVQWEIDLLAHLLTCPSGHPCAFVHSPLPYP